ncbi:hypothetical protein J4437_05095 [Candidatus Woesearchaeota archaeon]|nr:hypothetical protein [Candidatus Woesearchaeota archaeon]
MGDKRPFNLCIECDEVITEPICAECLAERMRSFVEEHDSKLAAKIQSSVIEDGESECIFCSKKMNLCAYCFSREIYDFLVEKKPHDEELIEDFVSRFDFDLRRTIY